MDRLLELSSQRIKALDTIKSAVNSINENVTVAQSSHESDGQKETLIDAANKWHILVKQDAFQKGTNQGYANACKDFGPLLQNLFEALEQERNNLQGLFEELLAVKGEKIDDVDVQEVRAEASPLGSKRQRKSSK